MKEDVIRQVKDAETQAEEKIHKTKAKADKIIQDARHQAVELRLKLLEETRANAKAMFETGAKKFEPELEKVQQTFKDEIVKDSEQAQKKIDMVVDFVVTQFEERLGN